MNRTHRTTVVSCLENHSSSSFSPNTILYPHFGQEKGTKRVSNWYSPNKRELEVHTFTCLHFHFSLQLTTTNHINNQSKFLLSCAHALHFTFSPYHREQERCVRLSAQHLLVIYMSDTLYGCPFTRESSSSSTFYPHFGQRTGATRVSNWYSA